MDKVDKTDLIAGMMLMHLAEDIEEVTGNAEDVINDPDEDVEEVIPLVNSILANLTPEQRDELTKVCLRMASMAAVDSPNVKVTKF